MRLTIQPLIGISELKNISRYDFNKNIHIYKNGRSSLYVCLKIILEKYNAEQILLPVVICDEIISVIKQFNIRIIFYEVNDNLDINFENLKTKLANKKNILLAVNFFGFTCNWKKINNLKNIFDMVTIEDNAHCQISQDIHADFTFYSLRKVYPLLSGSILKINNSEYETSFVYKTSLPKIEELVYFMRNYIRLKSTYSKVKNRNATRFNPKDLFIDFISKYLINGVLKDNQKHQKIRLNNYNYWLNYLPENELSPIFRFENDHKISPYVYPCIASSKKCAEKWLKWGIDRNITIMSWPKFPSMITEDMLTDAHKNILCFPVNQQVNVAEFLEDV